MLSLRKWNVMLAVCTMSAVLGATMAVASSVPRTGQTKTFGEGDDGYLLKGVSWPAPRFVDNGDGTITDELTNLVWTKDGDCRENVMTWQKTLDYVQNLSDGQCGLTDGSQTGDWRLPNVRELESLLWEGGIIPAVPNTEGTGTADNDDPFTSFPAADGNPYYWTSTTVMEAKDYAFIANIRYGHISTYSKSSTRYGIYVRDNSSGTAEAEVPATGQKTCYKASGDEISCAGSGQDGELQKGTTWPQVRFVDNADGTITDELTGLIWLKNAGCNKSPAWRYALNEAASLSSGSCGLIDGSVAGDWRLPNRKELFSLIDFEQTAPALSDTTGDGSWNAGDAFTNVHSSSYWSSTTYSGETDNARVVDLATGKVSILAKDGSVPYSWFVRGAFKQTVTVEVNGSGTVVSTPAGIDCPGECSADFGRDDEVQLVATSESGYRFEGWNWSVCGTAHACSFTAGDAPDSAITASFIEGGAGHVPSTVLLLKKD